MKPHNPIVLFPLLLALGGLGETTEIPSRNYGPRSKEHWDEKREAKVSKKQQRQNKKKNRR